MASVGLTHETCVAAQDLDSPTTLGAKGFRGVLVTLSRRVFRVKSLIQPCEDGRDIGPEGGAPGRVSSPAV